MPKTVFTGAHRRLVEILIATRKKAGLTQTELGERIGRDQSLISLIEGSQRRVDVLEFCELAQAMNVDPIDLLRKVLNAVAEHPER